MMAIYNYNFDGTSNRAIEQLVSRTNDKRNARVNRKNGASALDMLIFESGMDMLS